MPTRFVRATGSDAAAGTSAGTAWATLAKLLGASGIQSGETAYIGSGIFRENVTVAMTSATVETKILADVDGAQTGDAGPVEWTSYTTNDTTAAAASRPLDLSGRDFLTFEGIRFQGGNTTAGPILANTATSTDITFRRCVFIAGAAGADLITLANAAGVAYNWTLDSCTFNANNSTSFRLTAAQHTVDYDLNFVIKNCVFRGPAYALLALLSGTGAGLPGGIIFLNCLIDGTANGISLNGTWSTSVPARVYNCFFSNCTQGVSSTTGAALLEDFNLFHCSTARTNVTAGANSIATYADAPALDFGYSALNGFLPRPFYEPRAAAPLLGFGNSGTVSPPAVDIANRPRPAGGGSTSNSVGPYERHDTGAREASVVDASTNSLRLTGPADHDLLIPVSAAATTLTVRVQYDANHGTTNKPQALLLANGEIGVSAQTVTAAGGVGAWETLTVGPFTPTAAGWVTLRLVSRAAAGNGIAYFDTLTSTVAIGTGSEDYWKRGEAFPAATTSGTGGGGPGHTLVVRGQNLPAY